MSAAVGITKTGVRIEPIVLCAALLAMFVVNLQLWGIETPPLVDWPNHLARHVLQCGATGAELLGRYFQYQLQLVPNLTSELIHTLDFACRDPDLTQKYLIQASSVGLVFATVILHRTIWGSFSVWPVISGLIMHHMAWAYGFENFVLAIPVALLVLSVWFALAEKSALVRLLTLWPLVAGLYVLHIYAFAFLFLAVATLEVDRIWTRRASEAIWRSAPITFALLALVVAFPAFHTLNAAQSSTGIETARFSYGGLITLLTTLTSPFAGYGDPLQSAQARVSALIAMLAFIVLVLGVRSVSTGMAVDPRVRRILPVLLIATLVAPINFFGVFYSNIRLPVLTLAVLIAATRVEMPTRVMWAFAIAVLLVVTAKTSWIASQWRLHERQVAELRQAGEFLMPTDRLLVVAESRSPTVVLHSHSTSYLVRDQGSFWMGMFTGGNSLSPRPEYAARDHTQPFPFNWHILGPDNQHLPVFGEGELLHEWSSFYTHVLLLFDPERERLNGDPLGELVVSGSFFGIYAVSPAPAEDWP